MHPCWNGGTGIEDVPETRHSLPSQVQPRREGTGACGPGLSWVPGMVERGERRRKESQGERSGKEDGRKKGKKEGRRGKCVGLHVTPSKMRIEC